MKKLYRYIVYVTIHDGEFSYSQTSTLERLTKQTEGQIKKFVQEWFGFKDSYQGVRLNGYKEISASDYNVLTKYNI